MEFQHEEKRTPTFRQWAGSTEVQADSRYDIERIFCNREWRSITFVTTEFRINCKLETDKLYDSKERELGKILTKHCRAYITVQTQERANITVTPASDADERPQLFERDDKGFVSKTA